MPTLEPSEDIVNAIQRALLLLEENRSNELTEFLESLHPVELVGVINSVDEDNRDHLLKYITGLDKIAAVITYANENLRADVLNQLDDTQIATVLRHQEIDDAANTLGHLTRRRQIGILRHLKPALVTEITSLLSYENETAGRIMSPLFLAFPGDKRCEQTISELRHGLRTKTIDPETTITYAYVVDDSSKLTGVISLRKLLISPPDSQLCEIMTKEVVSVEPDEDQEDVARIISDYDFACVPVVSPEDSKLLGIVTVDDILDVIEEEHTEDLLRLAGTEDTDTIGASISTAIKNRLPWLMGSWMGGLSAAMLIDSFETTLHKLVALAFFMPVVFGMGGNVGSQSSTITVRGIATGDLSQHRVRGRLQKEVLVGVSLGAIFGLLLGIAAFMLYDNSYLSIIVGLSIFFTMICATSLGSMLPVMFHRIGFDPAVASGPLVTTITDILSIAIYFTIASFFLDSP